MSTRSGVALFLVLAAGCTRQSPTAPQANGASADAVAPVSGPAGAVDRSHRGATLPAAALTDLAGKPAPLAPGKPRLVNLWATWCAPCVAELPTLDRAAGQGTLDMVALDQGDDAGKVSAFLKTRPLAHIRPLIDRQLEVSVRLGANLPTTILYDAAGKEIWRVTGGRDWSSAASAKLLAEAR